MKNQQVITIEEAAEKVMTAALKEMTSLVDHNERIILGVKTGPLKTAIHAIKEDFAAASSLLHEYVSFYTGKEKSLEVFTTDITSLFGLPKKQLDHELRSRFIKHNNIQMPVFNRLNKEKFSELIEYTDQEESAFKLLTELVSEFGNRKKYTYFTEENFDKKLGQFQFTERLEYELKERHTKIATNEQLASLISLCFLVQGLNDISDNSIKYVYTYDDSIKDTEMEKLLYTARQFIKFDENGIGINMQKLKLSFGFDESLSKISIIINRDRVVEDVEAVETKRALTLEQQGVMEPHEHPFYSRQNGGRSSRGSDWVE